MRTDLTRRSFLTAALGLPCALFLAPKGLAAPAAPGLSLPSTPLGPNPFFEMLKKPTNGYASPDLQAIARPLPYADLKAVIEVLKRPVAPYRFLTSLPVEGDAQWLLLKHHNPAIDSFDGWSAVKEADGDSLWLRTPGRPIPSPAATPPARRLSLLRLRRVDDFGDGWAQTLRRGFYEQVEGDMYVTHTIHGPGPGGLSPFLPVVAARALGGPHGGRVTRIDVIVG